MFAVILKNKWDDNVTGEILLKKLVKDTVAIQRKMTLFFVSCLYLIFLIIVITFLVKAMDHGMYM